jgi:hypothetical protein
MAKQIQWIEAEELEKRYGIKGWEIMQKINGGKIFAYSKENLTSPLDPKTVLIDKERVKAHNGAKQRSVLTGRGDINNMMSAFIPWHYYLFDCVFQMAEVKKCFPERISDQGSPKKSKLTLAEFVKDPRFEFALFVADELFAWANKPETKKPVTRERFFKKFDRIKKDRKKAGLFVEGSDKDIGTAIWGMWAENHPEIRTTTDGGRQGAGKVKKKDPEN